MIRLRQSLEVGLRHPLLGPLVLLFLGLILAFVVFHAVVDGVEGMLFSCAIFTAVSLSVLIVCGRFHRATPRRLLLLGRDPPRRCLARPRFRSAIVLPALPLRL